MYIYIYVYVYICMYIHVCISTHTHIYTYIHIYIYTYKYRHLGVQIYIYIYVYKHATLEIRRGPCSPMAGSSLQGVEDEAAQAPCLIDTDLDLGSSGGHVLLKITIYIYI